MKCDDLKAMNIVQVYKAYNNDIIDAPKHHYYNKQDVDEAIAELKQLRKKKLSDEKCQFCTIGDKTILEIAYCPFCGRNLEEEE